MTDDQFAQIPLFQGLSSAQLDLLRPIFVPCDGCDGTVLFGQGEPADQLYLVLSGEVTIRYKPDDGPEITLAKVRPGGMVGWSALLGRRFYTSRAMCSKDSQILRVRGEDLRNVCDQHPQMGEVVLDRLAAMVAERLRNTHQQVVDLLKHGLAYG
jgi:CRP-like cAMP-binding protein